MKTKAKAPTLPVAEEPLRRRFGKVARRNLVSAGRTFPIAARAGVQCALEKLFRAREHRLLGAHTQYHHETMTIAHWMGNQHYPVVIGPLQHEEIDIGGALPARVLRHGKELMRRAAQFHLQSGSNGYLQPDERNAAWEEILLGGGSLNLKLLGGANMAHKTVH